MSNWKFIAFVDNKSFFGFFFKENFVADCVKPASMLYNIWIFDECHKLIYF